MQNQLQTQRINLISLVKRINDLKRDIESPKISNIIIHPDYILVNWNEIEREQWGSMPYKIPLVTNTRIEYKRMYDSLWNKISTGSDSTTTCCLYKKNEIHKFSRSHLVDNSFWNEYDALEEDFLYDIRICYENYKETQHWTTLSSLGISSLPPTFNFCGFLTSNIENPITNQCYLVIDNNDSYWKTYKNCLALYNMNGGINHRGWVIYFPRKGWMIDNFYFDGNEWIDIKLKNSLLNLNKIVTSKDVLFKILNSGFSSRFFSEMTLSEYYEKYIEK